MSVQREPRGQLADIARQARELLGQVRDSRWPGFEPPAAASRLPRQQGRSTPAPARQRPAPSATASAPIPVTVAAAANVSPREPSPWKTLEEVAEAVGACTKCPLHATRTRTVPGEGAPQARLMFVGEAPGADEDRLGRPFVGAAGKLLEDMIRAMGLAREGVFIANVLKCRPPANRDPQEQEVAACIPYLRAQIDLIRPEVICTLGRHATHALLGRTDPLGKLRGRFFEYRGTPLMPTYHPSYLLRTPADKKPAWNDLQQIMSLLGLPLPEQHATKERGR